MNADDTESGPTEIAPREVEDAAVVTAELVLMLLSRDEHTLPMLALATTAAQHLVCAMHDERSGNPDEIKVAFMAAAAFSQKVIADSTAGRVPVETVLEEMARRRTMKNPPIYDDVFFEGLAALDADEGPDALPTDVEGVPV